MKVERYQSFTVAHKGLRNALSQILFLAGNTDYSNTQEVEKLYQLGKKVFALMEGHAEDENNIILAELEVRMPNASHHDKHDHEQIEEKQKELENLLTAMYDETQSGLAVNTTGHEFFTKFSTFFGEYMLHMVHEETVTQQQLWDNFTDAELLVLTQRIVSKISLDKTLVWYSFMFPAMNSTERLMLYRGVKGAMPVEVFEVVDEAIKQFLPHDAYQQLNVATATM